MPKDSLDRRSRFVRQPSGKPIVLTDRDVEFLLLLYRYRYLRTAQLAAFLKQTTSFPQLQPGRGRDPDWTG